MASDAKVGLLLGLVFIFIIALIINGLPSFNEDRNNNELTTNMVGSQNRSPAIAAKQREVINRRAPVVKKPAAVELASADNQSATAEPEGTPVVMIRETAAEQAIAAVAQAVAAKNESWQTSSSETVPSKVYVVSKGDTLAAIALKFYGSQEGNKRANVARIFDANRKLLKSPDELSIGQKLTIPPLPGSVPDKGKGSDVLSGKKFVKVESISSRHLLANNYRQERPEQVSWHVVQQGDSLWQIAAEQLGDGSRYGEIAKLNAGTLDGADNLFVGMRLKIPVR
jgi:nucleoid-associated protein YgaU